MKNHTVFSYVDLAPDKFFDGKKITYRSLAGTRRDGTAVFVLSGDGGVCNVSEVAELAKKLDVQHATLLDGARAAILDPSCLGQLPFSCVQYAAQPGAEVDASAEVASLHRGEAARFEAMPILDHENELRAQGHKRAAGRG